MNQEKYIRNFVRKILTESEDDGSTSNPFGSSDSPGDGSDDWSSPTGRKSNEYKAAEAAAAKDPAALLRRLGVEKLDNPKTNQVKDIENFLKQTTMSNSDLSQVYGTIQSKGDAIMVTRRKRAGSGGSMETSAEYITKDAASARYISLLLIAASRLKWVDYLPGRDTVMFGGVDNGFIRVLLNAKVHKEEPEPDEKA
jgi:hypothetical protein